MQTVYAGLSMSLTFTESCLDIQCVVSVPHILSGNWSRALEYVISHVSAMDLHRMLTQPQFVMFLPFHCVIMCTQ